MSGLQAPATTKIILVVEDEPFFARMCVRTLERPGREVRVAADGKAALEEIERSPPDILLLDLLLPHVDGFSIMEKLRTMERNFPIVILSNLGREANDEICADLGVCAYYMKSETSLEELEKIVERHLA